MPTHVALLRGINVGGTGKVPMAELRAQLTARGFTGVATYIQSGNVVLDSADPDPAAVAARVEQVLREHFAVPRPVVVFGRDSYAAAVAANPFPQVVEPTRLHAVFRAAPPTPTRTGAADGGGTVRNRATVRRLLDLLGCAGGE